VPGFVLWFTGLSGSGKSTLAALVSAELRRRGVHVETLDGDEIRKNLSKGIARLLVSATWLEHVGARSSRLGVTGPTTTIDPLPPLLFDEHIGGFVSVRSKSYRQPPPLDERAHEVRPEVAASGRSAT
jgi:hypothetical protein